MPAKQTASFNVDSFLRSAGVGTKPVAHPATDIIFSAGEASDTVLFIQSGTVKLSVLSKTGKEAIVALLEPGDFLGEHALTGHPVRLVTATAISPTRILPIPKRKMLALLHQEHAFSDRFIAYMLSRNIRIEADLVDQLFNSTEKRLARALLLLARYGKPGETHRDLPRVSQETLAEIIGSTRSRVNFFMNKFKRLKFIEYNGGIRVNDSLLTVVLHD